MPEKRILCLTNGYGEDSFAQLICTALLEEMENQHLPFHLSLLPLIGEGQSFQELLTQYPGRVSLLHRSPIFPYEGIYTGNFLTRFFRFMVDMTHGGFKNILFIASLLGHMRKKSDLVLVVGDALPLLLVYLFNRQKAYFFACTRTTLLRQKGAPYERLGRFNAFVLRHCAHRVYTRDEPTAQWFRSLGICATYHGFVAPRWCEENRDSTTVLFLPGQRGEWKKNFLFLAQVITQCPDLWRSLTPHFAFSSKLSPSEIRVLIQSVGQMLSPSTFLLNGAIVSWSHGDYFTHLPQTAVVVGFAGTALHYAAYLGIPCLRPYLGNDARLYSHSSRCRQKLILGEALIDGGSTLEETVLHLREALSNLSHFRERAKNFSRRVWQKRGDGAKNIAQELVSILRTLPQHQDRTPELLYSRSGR